MLNIQRYRYNFTAENNTSFGTKNYEFDFFKKFKLFILFGIIISGVAGYIYTSNLENYYKSNLKVNISGSSYIKSDNLEELTNKLNSLIYGGIKNGNKLSIDFLSELINYGVVKSFDSNKFVTNFSPDILSEKINMILILNKELDSKSIDGYINAINKIIFKHNSQLLYGIKLYKNRSEKIKVDMNFNYEGFINDMDLLNQLKEKKYIDSIVEFRKKYNLFSDKTYMNTVYRSQSKLTDPRSAYKDFLADSYYLYSIRKISDDEKNKLIKLFYESMLKYENSYNINQFQIAELKNQILPFIQLDKNANYDINNLMDRSTKIKYTIVCLFAGGIFSTIICILYLLFFKRFNIEKKCPQI